MILVSVALLGEGIQITIEIIQMYRLEWVKVPNIECEAQRSHTGRGGGRTGFENWIFDDFEGLE